MNTATILRGDAVTMLRTLPDNSVHCVVTSPPYYGLRDYGIDGQIGLEDTPAEYVERLVAVFREVRRVLRDDGVCWLNLGDSYAANRGYQIDGTKQTNGSQPNKGSSVPDGLKPKDMLGIPWRVAFALQDAGWWLRQDIIWHKPNPMPESVQDRCTKAHEYVFLLTKSARYFYDAQAVAEPAQLWTGQAATFARNGTVGDHILPGQSAAQHRPDRVDSVSGSTRNRRSVWAIATEPTPYAHFATMPTALAETCILAGCPAQVCAVCGAPWVRVVEKPDMADRPKRSENAKTKAIDGKWTGASSAGQAYQDWRNANPNVTLGFRPTCTCDAGTMPGTVLDPFAGSGTTLRVAVELGRNAIGIELNPEYADIADRLLSQTQPALFGI